MRQRERGQSLIEYALLGVLAVTVAIGALRVFGVNVGGLFCQVVTGIGVPASGICSPKSGGGMLVRDDFSGDLNQWRFDNDKGSDKEKKWKQDDGQLCAKEGGERRAFAKGSNGSDYTIALDANLKEDNGYGVFFRATTDPLNGYTFQYDPSYGGGQFIMRKWVNGYEIWPPVAAAPAPKGYQWKEIQRHVKIVVKGDTFVATIDGQPAVTGKDSTYASGEAGLRTWGSSEACFDNFTVTAP